MSKRVRNSLPTQLNGCLSFGDQLLHDPLDLIRLVRSQPAIWRALQAGTNLDRGEGRPRGEGHWSLAFLAFLISGQRDLKRWHGRCNPKLWMAADFDHTPSYDATYYNFRLLEENADAFQAAAALLIQKAVKGSDGLVGQDVHVDGTEAETNARLIHDCKAGCCPRIPDWKGPKGKKGGMAAKALTSEAREKRHMESELAPEDLQSQIVEQNGKRFKMKHCCWYRTADPEAGIRAYGSGKKKFWHGYYHHKAVDHYTGGVLATVVESASVNEFLSYDQLLSNVMENTGAKPRAVVADRGFSVKDVFERNSKLGIASVMPYRKSLHEKERIDHERFDRHGIPYCKHCGSPSRYVRFVHTPKPRLWFECTMPSHAGCESKQSILCEENYLYLLPLWRNTEAYQALRQSHSNFERRHHDWRDWYLVAGDSHNNRPRRRGIGCQILRSNAAMLVEWLGICYRQGWLGGKRLNEQTPFINHAMEALRAFNRARIRLGLHLPKHLAASHAAEYQRFRELGYKSTEPPPLMA